MKTLTFTVLFTSLLKGFGCLLFFCGGLGATTSVSREMSGGLVG